VVSVIEMDRGLPEPMEKSTQDEQVAEATDDLPGFGTLLEAASFVALLLLRRSIDSELRVGLLPVLQELLVLRIDGQGNGLFGLEEIHGGREGEGEGSGRGFGGGF